MPDFSYGIDPNLPLTPLLVRDALENCFYNAHREAIDLENNSEQVTKEYCRQMVQQAFHKTGGQYDQPTKKSIMAATNYLSRQAKNFRNQEVISQHVAEIMKYVDTLA